MPIKKQDAVLTLQVKFLEGTIYASNTTVQSISDIRTKENIKAIGWLPNGLPVYTYEYKSEFKDHPLAGHGTHTGVMAQEVEVMYPNAVITLHDGYKAVDYGKL